MDDRTQSRLLMQFHITGRCNLSCKHCYRVEGDVEPLTLENVKMVIEQFKELLKKYNRLHQIKKKGHINITGGEPFIRKDIKEILQYLGRNRDMLSYGILSNGSFINDEITRILKDTGVSFVQLSIDGNRETHDNLRAPGDYDRVFNVAKYLEKRGIKTYISFTANKENYKYIPEVAVQCRKRYITKLWSDRLVPIGTGEELAKLSIDKTVLSDYLATMKKAQGNFITKAVFPKTQVTMNRALQFQSGSGGYIYSCSAGDSLITVDEFGQVMPCRRMPIICGTVLKSTLEEIYFGNEVFRELRKNEIPEECSRCIYNILCRGGARCQAHAAYGDFKSADPGCPFVR